DAAGPVEQLKGSLGQISQGWHERSSVSACDMGFVAGLSQEGYGAVPLKASRLQAWHNGSAAVHCAGASTGPVSPDRAASEGTARLLRLVYRRGLRRHQLLSLNGVLPGLP